MPIFSTASCPIHHRPVEWLEEDNWFFELSKFTQPLLDWYGANPGFVQPDGKRNEALGMIRQGLEDVSISRTSIDWGVPVPWDEGHVFYVWYDALINYATAVGYATDRERFDAWWPEVHHLIGKDILRFHCVYWPAMCLAAGIEPPKNIAVHGFLLVGGEKMSKTSLNQIFPADLVEEFGVDGFRYQFLRDSRSVPMATSPTRAWSPATTPTWPTIWATCCAGWRRSWPKSAAGSAPRLDPTPSAARRGRRGGRRRPAKGWAASPVAGSRGHVEPGRATPTPILKTTSRGRWSRAPRRRRAG